MKHEKHPWGLCNEVIHTDLVLFWVRPRTVRGPWCRWRDQGTCFGANVPSNLLCCHAKLVTQYHSKYLWNLGLECKWRGFPGGSVIKSPPANAGDRGSIPDPGRSHMTCGTTKPMHDNSWAWAVQLMLYNKRRHHNEKPEHHNQRVARETLIGHYKVLPIDPFAHPYVSPSTIALNVSSASNTVLLTPAPGPPSPTPNFSQAVSQVVPTTEAWLDHQDKIGPTLLLVCL